MDNRMEKIDFSEWGFTLDKEDKLFNHWSIYLPQMEGKLSLYDSGLTFSVSLEYNNGDIVCLANNYRTRTIDHKLFLVFGCWMGEFLPLRPSNFSAYSSVELNHK